MSVVTAPAVPLPTRLTAAAWAFAAASPVTGFSASSCAAVPCAGPLNAGRDCAVDPVGIVVVAVFELAAPAIAEPPSASAANPATTTSVFWTLVNMCPSPFVVRADPGFADHRAGGVREDGPRSLRIRRARRCSVLLQGGADG